MNVFSALASKQPKFTHLLVDLIVIFILSPLGSNSIGYLILSGGFFLANLLVIRALPLAKVWVYLLRIIAFISFIIDIIYLNKFTTNSDFLYLIANGIDSSFILLAILLIGSQIFKQKK